MNTNVYCTVYIGYYFKLALKVEVVGFNINHFMKYIYLNIKFVLHLDITCSLQDSLIRECSLKRSIISYYY